MAYTKPVIVAQNGATGVFAAGCPANRANTGVADECKRCERTA